jgi:ribosomal protein S18 acetylase RimI-like enzyme
VTTGFLSISLNSSVPTIRSATADDARAIATIHVEAWRAAYRGIVPDEYLDSLSIDGRESTWRQNLLAADTSTWVAQESDAVVGWISAGPSRDTDADRSADEIWAVYVAPERWGKGVGSSLCLQAEQHLRTDGCIAVTLWVLKDNERAVKFYQSNGFVLDIGATKERERGGKTLSEVRFRKPLIAGCESILLRVAQRLPIPPTDAQIRTLEAARCLPPVSREPSRSVTTSDGGLET